MWLAAVGTVAPYRSTKTHGWMAGASPADLGRRSGSPYTVQRAPAVAPEDNELDGWPKLRYAVLRDPRARPGRDVRER